MGKRKTRQSPPAAVESWRMPIALAILAAVRVLLYSAAFPLFNNVDEADHADMVVKYASGAMPRAIEPLAAESARLLVLYSTSEYFEQPAESQVARPPNWIIARDEPGAVAVATAPYKKEPNLESGEPPLYYAIAGGWYNLGKVCGVRGGPLIFWVRFFNVFAIVPLVLLAYYVGRRVFPETNFIAICAAGLIAFMPQDAFYSVANDGWTALLAGLSFVLLITPPPAGQLSLTRMMLAGWAIGAACVTKLSSLPLLPLALVLATLVLLRHRLAWRRFALGVTLFAACALIPFTGWCLRNIATVADPTATAEKIAALRWTVKPISQWLPHPIVSISGAYGWLSELLASFWRGEFVWHLTRIASSPADAFYFFSTLLLPGIALAALLKSKDDSHQRFVTLTAVISIGAMLLFIIFLSLRYDFDGCFYPSREKPYFTSGRLLLPALIPFVLLYARGLWIIACRWTPPVQYVLIGLLALAISVDEVVISRPAFGNHYNLFQMLANNPYAAEGE